MQNKRLKYMQVVLGKQDDIIKPKDNIEFLNNENIDRANYSVYILNHIGHQIPIKEFESELSKFFNSLERIKN